MGLIADKYVEIPDKHGRIYQINREQVAAIVVKEGSGFLWVYFVAGNSVEIDTNSYYSAVRASEEIRGITREKRRSF